ncbi:hypothetical protein EDD11_003445 [Mortierella claussenii]|nr:hypothetical protein EDD11_003445 [Mortierella claussenii]
MEGTVNAGHERKHTRDEREQEQETLREGSLSPSSKMAKPIAKTSPTLRKEQNRAAQRAFRNRKERHLQQLENMIRDLKEQQFHLTTRFQREVRCLRSHLETTITENHYLREVVFAFEVTLCKGGYTAVLQDVKQELHRQHHEKQTHVQQRPVTCYSKECESLPQQSTQQSTQQATQQSTQQHQCISGSPPLSHVPLQQPVMPKDPPHPLTMSLSVTDSVHELQMYSVDREILYRAPPLFISVVTVDGDVTSVRSPLESLSAPRPSFVTPGTHLPKHTDYTKHPTVFDELQSSLFPPGTLESVVQSGMATPQEVVNDDSTMFDHLHLHIDGDLKVDGDGIKAYAKKMGLMNGNHRLQREFQLMVASPPAIDPNISPQIYELPHDSRIDLIPCPKLRAQMILHQNKYDLDALFQLLIDGAICHGPPMDVHSWELPDEFFDRFGFLMGQDMERIRRKIWPRKQSC